MTKLHFHKDKNLFMDWLMLNQMSTGEIALWHTLMNIGNRLGQKHTFNVPTSTLMKLTGLSKQGVINARKKLLEGGFIRYEKGYQNKAPIYEMVPLNSTIDLYFSTNNEQELTQNSTQDLTRNLTSELTIHKEKHKEKRRGGSGRERHFLFKTYEENINKLTPLTEEAMIEWIGDAGEAIVEEAIIISVKKGGRTFSYVETILKGWKNAGLSTIEEVQSYELRKELEKSKKLIPFRKQKNEAKQEGSLEELLKEEF